MFGRHPYREPPNEASARLPSSPLADAQIGDLFLAILLLLVGVLGIVVGILADRATELTIGGLLVVLGAKVAWEARQISI